MKLLAIYNIERNGEREELNDAFSNFQAFIKEGTEKGYDIVDQLFIADKITTNEILPYIYEKNKQTYDGLFILDKSHIASDITIFYSFLQECSKKNINIVGLKNGNMTELFEASLDFQNAKQKQEKSKQAMDDRIQKADNGLWGGGKKLPLGYKVGKYKKLEILEEEAIIVKKIFEWYLEGNTCNTIAHLIGDQYNMKTSIGTKNERYWQAERIYYILTNPIYIGNVTINRNKFNNKKRVPSPRSEWYISKNKHDDLAIIDDDTFQKVHAKVWYEDKKLPKSYMLKDEEYAY